MPADSPLLRDQATAEGDAALDVWREGDRTVIGLGLLVFLEPTETTADCSNGKHVPRS